MLQLLRINVSLNRIMLSEKSFPCPQCGLLYKYESTRTRHLKYECRKKAQFKCSQCKHATKQKGNLKRHLRTVHKNNISNSIPWDLTTAAKNRGSAGTIIFDIDDSAYRSYNASLVGRRSRMC